MWVVVQQKTVSISPETFGRLSNASPYETTEVSAEVSVEAMFGGEVLSYVRMSDVDDDDAVAVVYADSVTRRVCHVVCDGTMLGDGYHRVHQQEAYVFNDEQEARDAAEMFVKLPRSSVVQFRQLRPVWSSVLLD